MTIIAAAADAMGAPVPLRLRLGLGLTCTVAISWGGAQATPLHLLQTPTSLPRPFMCWQHILQQQKHELALPGCSPHVQHWPMYAAPPRYARLVGKRPS